MLGRIRSTDSKGGLITPFAGKMGDAVRFAWADCQGLGPMDCGHGVVVEFYLDESGPGRMPRAIAVRRARTAAANWPRRSTPRRLKSGRWIAIHCGTAPRIRADRSPGHALGCALRRSAPAGLAWEDRRQLRGGRRHDPAGAAAERGEDQAATAEIPRAFFVLSGVVRIPNGRPLGAVE